MSSRVRGRPLSRLRVLVGFEFSGRVRDAFIKEGHDAISCDLLDTERPGPHLKMDIKEAIEKHGPFDLAIFHPPCTHLAVSGARWFKNKRREQKEALELVRWLLAVDIPYIALENPVSVISSQIRKPDQVVQPWMFGHGETKATCLWLYGLPKLKPTRVVKGRKGRIHNEPPGPDRWKNRSRTLPGIARAMAKQWGEYVRQNQVLLHK